MPDWTYCNSRFICRINYATFANHCKAIFICIKIIVIFPLALGSGEIKYSHIPSNQKNIFQSYLCSASTLILNKPVHECHEYLRYFAFWGMMNSGQALCLPMHTHVKYRETHGLCALRGECGAHTTADQGQCWGALVRVSSECSALQSCAQSAV